MIRMGWFDFINVDDLLNDFICNFQFRINR